MSNARRVKPTDSFDGERDARRGTPLHGLNQVRSVFLSDLIFDLKKIEKGFSEDKCVKIRRLLFDLLSSMQQLPNGGFHTEKAVNELKEFDKVYTEWNNVVGEDEFAATQRKQILKQLQNRRNSLSRHIAQHQADFFHSLDDEFVTQFVSKLKEVLPVIDPETTLFPKLSNGVHRYEQRISKVLNYAES